MTDLPRPFLKWAGGKGQMLDRLLSCFPKTIEKYYEPFLGGGAVFFALARERCFKRAVLSDSNEELINAYVVLRDEPKKLISELKRHTKHHSEEHYYEVRGSKPRGMVQRAARTIYLNKTGFNGLYRVNRNGEFNVPFGGYASPRILDLENLQAASEALQGVTLRAHDFGIAQVDVSLNEGSVVYFDPPYIPVGDQSFTQYHRLPFGMEEHERLAATFRCLADLGVSVVLTNSSAPETYSLYEGWPMMEVDSRRSINRNGAARGAVKDVIVTSSTTLLGACPSER